MARRPSSSTRAPGSDRVWVGLSFVLSLVGCESRPLEVAVRSEPVIYGEDDREELYQVEQDALRERLARAVVALLPAAQAAPGEPGHEAPFGERFELCDAEPFEAQPAAALCTGVLVDWDLILTASHCVRVVPLDELRAVFGWAYRAPGELAATPGSSYGLAEIVQERHDPRGAAPRLDYAFVRLTHSVEPPLEPIPIALEPARAEQPLVIAGASFGLPIKIDRAAEVRDARASASDFFIADSDTSRGASGGPALDARHALLGVLARGGDDLREREDGCVESIRKPTEAAEEEYTYAARALEGLCESGAASSLCRGDCGDPCEALAPVEAPPSCSMATSTAGAPRSLALCGAIVICIALRRRRAAPRAQHWT